MARRIRIDEPGAYHHVLNRAIARRPLFESRADGRYFLAQLAKRVRAGQLEVIAYSLMTTHYHLLVRSPRGELSEAIRMATNAYSRWFNRRYRRDGPLFRGRFLSRRVNPEAYRAAVLRYIDRNPVAARIVSDPTSYALGSARRHASERPGPWLSRAWLEEYVQRSVHGPAPFDAKYRVLCQQAVPDSVRQMVEARLWASGQQEDTLDELVTSAPPRILAWMRRKARLSDGGRLLAPVAGVDAVSRAISERVQPLISLPVDEGSRAPGARATVTAALQRQLAGASLAHIAEGLDVTEMTVRRYIRAHERRMAESDRRYADLAEEVARAAIEEAARVLRPA